MRVRTSQPILAGERDPYRTRIIRALLRPNVEERWRKEARGEIKNGEKRIEEEFLDGTLYPASDSPIRMCYDVAGSLRVTAEKPLYG